MKCPICSNATRVLSTRREVVRRRECVVDERHRFTTVETVALQVNENNHIVMPNATGQDGLAWPVLPTK